MLCRSGIAGVRALVGQVRPRQTTFPRASWSFSTSVAVRSINDGLPSDNPVGVARALQAAPVDLQSATPTIFTHEFSLADRVALVSGANRGIGLEMALALVEAGARAVYCVDLLKTPGEEWVKVREYAKALGGKTGGEGRLEYVSADVRDQEGMGRIGEMIGDREGRMDVCIAAAGILPKAEIPCLTYSAEQFQEILGANIDGALFTAQAAGQQMQRFGNGGSIILIASVSGHGTNKGFAWVAYKTSKSAVLQMTRSMACDLGPEGIRVNSISPGTSKTKSTKRLLSSEEARAKEHPLGRVGRPDELRGAAVWLASDASSFCTGSDFFVSGGYQA